MTINPDTFFYLVQAYALRFDKLTHVDQIMTQTHHATDTFTVLPLTKVHIFQYHN